MKYLPDQTQNDGYAFTTEHGLRQTGRVHLLHAADLQVSNKARKRALGPRNQGLVHLPLLHHASKNPQLSSQVQAQAVKMTMMKNENAAALLQERKHVVEENSANLQLKLNS
jgi:hypothetical protein